jgi:hypothetical protein
MFTSRSEGRTLIINVCATSRVNDTEFTITADPSVHADLITTGKNLGIRAMIILAMHMGVIKGMHESQPNQ